MKDSEYLKNLFIEYIPTLSALNELTESFNGKDEFRLRHKVAKKIITEYNIYRFKLYIQKIKIKFAFYRSKVKNKKMQKTIKDYNELKNSGKFLPKL